MYAGARAAGAALGGRLEGSQAPHHSHVRHAERRTDNRTRASFAPRHDAVSARQVGPLERIPGILGTRCGRRRGLGAIVPVAPRPFHEPRSILALRSIALLAASVQQRRFHDESAYTPPDALADIAALRIPTTSQHAMISRAETSNNIIQK
jgi:hypothetical protein